MPKKNAKTAPAQEAPAKDQGTKDAPNAWMNFVKNSFVHQRTAKESGKEIYTISVPYENSTTGYASFVVNPGQVFQSTKKTKDGESMDVEGYSNILLGPADKARKVSVAVGKDQYEQIEMTNAQISELFNAEREKYRESKKAEREASREVPQVDGAEASAEAEMGE